MLGKPAGEQVRVTVLGSGSGSASSTVRDRLSTVSPGARTASGPKTVPRSVSSAVQIMSGVSPLLLLDRVMM